MERIITAENLRYFAYVNDAVCSRPVRGVILNFMGLGNQAMHSEELPEGIRFGGAGFVYVIPYLNPWAWMNQQAVRQTDEIVDALLERLGASQLPLVSSGGSMGGLSALIYTRYSRHRPVACVTNCPVCDLPYHYTERPDLPRTLYSAFGSDHAPDLAINMAAASPLHLAEKGDMPAVPYVIFHCEADMAVNKQRHSDRFVAAMQPISPVEYHAVPHRGHCDLPEEVRALYERRMMELAGAPLR